MKEHKKAKRGKLYNSEHKKEMERQEIQRDNRSSNIILQSEHISALKQKPKEPTPPQLHMKKQSIKNFL